MKWLAVPAILLLTGCTSTITVPAAAPEDPVPVYLLDHGRHSSIVLPRSEDDLVRYAYGDWEWYAQMRTGPLRAFPTLLVRGQATLGRREFPGPRTTANVRRQVRIFIQDMWELEVEREAADALRGRLDGLHDEHRDTLEFNQLYDLEFVHHPEPYSLMHNSNHVTAQWLRELGLDVRMRNVLSRWRVIEARTD